jgi:hypothetical protein
MASTFSELKFELIGTGDQAGNWGETTNENIGTAIEQAITGLGNPVFTTDADLTISLVDSVALQTARALVLNITSTGSLTAPRNLVVPTIEKQYIAQNNTTGGRSITVKTAAGTGITVPNGAKIHLYVDGVNVVDAVSYFSSLTLGTPLGFPEGGTGQTTRQAAMDALAGSTTSGQYLRGNGTDVVMSAIQAADVPTLNQNTTGTAANVSGTVAVANGGTGATDATTARSNLVAARSGANTDITSIALTTGTITTAPVNNTDIVNKQYADAIASGIHFHEAVEYATTAALPACTYNNGADGVGATLTGNSNGALTVDAFTFTSPTNNGTRVLIKNQGSGNQNGVYTLTQAGNSSPGAPFILTRATDFDTVGTGVDQIDEGDFFLVTSGTANANTAWVQQTPPPITVGATSIVFQQFSAPITYTAGTGLSESPPYTFNIANVGSSGTYGSASIVPVITLNSQGQVTNVVNTSIFINNSSTTATSANTANAIVARDASGNFSAGTVTGAFSGNATTATTLQTARNIGGVSFNGSANIDLPGVNTSGNQNTSGTAANVTGTVAVANGGTGATTAPNARTNLGATTLGGNLFTITNPSAVTFPRFNADNTISSLDAAAFRTAIGATGTVTSVSGTGTVSGLSLSGTVTSSGSLTLGGTLAVSPSDFAAQTANSFLAAPNGSTGVPTFRAVVAADIPTLNQNTTGTAANVTGIVAVNNGGTGTGTPNLVAGTNVTITGTWPNQTINAAGGSGSGTVTSVAATVPSFLTVSGSPITTSGTLAISYSGTALPVANGGTGTTTPSLVAGANVTISGTWPNQTIATTGGGGGGGVFPFYKSSGVYDSISLIDNNALPFYKANGTQDNINIVSA